MSDSQPLRSNAFPVSVKGVVVRDGEVVLLRNERDEWELPGGRLELGEDLERCVAREVAEEVGWQVETGPILDAWLYHIFEGRDVFTSPMDVIWTLLQGRRSSATSIRRSGCSPRTRFPDSTCRPGTRSRSRPGPNGSAGRRKGIA